MPPKQFANNNKQRGSGTDAPPVGDLSSPLSPASPPASPVAPPAPTMAPTMALVLRENDAIHMAVFDGTAVVDTRRIVHGVDVSECQLAFAPSGSHFAFADLQSVSIVDCSTGDVTQKIVADKVVQLLFSPKGSLLVAYAHPDAKRPDGNLGVFNVVTGQAVLRASQGTWPALQWTQDEQFCLRVASGVLYVYNGTLESPEPLSKLEVQLPHDKQFECVSSPADLPLVGLFMPHHKSTQASFRVFRMPNVKEDMLSLNFGRSEGAVVQWSPSGSYIALTIKSESDKSGKSYYGTTTLSVVSIRERNAVNVPLPAGDYVHDMQWSPMVDEFIVVHGTMPKNKATLFSSKAVPLFTFGEAPRNLVRWAPNGKLFVLGGTGNLAGEFQFYDRDGVAQQKTGSGEGGKLGFFSEKSSVQYWSPDSRHLTCATVFTKLRVDNRLVMWKHNGQRVTERKFNVLQEASWVPSNTKFVTRAPSPTVAATEKPKSAAYRPPVASAAAAALLARAPMGSAGSKAKPVGPVGGAVVDPKKKVKR